MLLEMREATGSCVISLKAELLLSSSLCFLVSLSPGLLENTPETEKENMSVFGMSVWSVRRAFVAPSILP